MLKCFHDFKYKNCPYGCKMWDYSSTWRRHYINNGEFYSFGKNESYYLWEIRSSAPYGSIQEKHGYDLYYKGKEIRHGKTVKELKRIVQLQEGE